MSKTIATGLLVAILFIAYANHFENSFHFDDAHTTVNNAAIQSLRSVPRFFVDATTFSSLPSNQSYRPLVSTLFAIDYRLGGLNPFWFHLSISVLFVALILLLAFVIYRLIGNLWIAIGTAGLYELHPANADTVNYIIASAEIMSTIGIVASFAVYFEFPKLRRYYLYVLPAVIGILAKPTAAIFPILLAAYLFLFPESSAKRRLLGFSVPLVTCALVLLFVEHMTPTSWAAGATDAHNYLITEPYVALLYFKTFFWPTDLSADYDLNPFTSANDPRFWAGIVFIAVLVMMSILCARFKSTRVVAFGLLWFLIALLPTSLFPLAEVMNDHRTFLPYIGLVIAIAGAISILVRSRVAQLRLAKVALSCAMLLVLCASGYATFERNKVWRTEETLWRDVTIKSPNNSRGLMNYGNTLMAKGDFAGAVDYFHRALAFTPNYSVLLINLAIAEDATKQSATAEQHFKEALQLEPNSPDSYTFYARSLLAHGRPREAEALLRTALAISPNDMMARELLARIEKQVTGSAESETAEDHLNRSLELYRAERYEEAIASCNAALKLRPNYAEAWNNICAACNKLGRYVEAAAACEEALRIKPDFDLAKNNLDYARERSKGK